MHIALQHWLTDFVLYGNGFYAMLHFHCALVHQPFVIGMHGGVLYNSTTHMGWVQHNMVSQ